MKKKTQDLIKKVVSSKGEDYLNSLLTKHINSSEEENILTIVTNTRSHNIPESIIRGEKFILSHSDFDFSSSNKVVLALKKDLKRLAKKLKEKSWKTIYLIPSGHQLASKLGIFCLSYCFFTMDL